MVDPKEKIRVGIFAASSIVSEIEFNAGIEHLRASNFNPVIHAQVSKHHFIWPGTDEERAGAIYEYAIDPTIKILWAARGGYGAGRLLPLLDELTRENGVPPKKLLIGYSDVTVLHEFVRTRWNWSTLHAPMPAASNFAQLQDWRAIADLVRTKPTALRWEQKTLRWLTDPPKQTLQAELIGGNLSLWAALVGTKYSQPARNKILFLEDVDEPFYRIDRMMTQLVQSGSLDAAAAIVLGDFTNCNDENNQCLANATTGEKKPLRKVYDQPEAWQHIFTNVGNKLGIPIAQGLPVGHGPNYAPLPLGAQYELSPQGKIRLVSWDWLAQLAPGMPGAK